MRTILACAVVMTGLAWVPIPAQEPAPASQSLIAPQYPASVDNNTTYYLKHAFGPSAYLGSALSASYGQLRNSPYEWRQDMDGLGRRLASAYARRLIGISMDLGVSTWHGEVMAYDRCICQGFVARSGHALKRTFVRKTQDGGSTFALGRFAGAYGAGLASNLWYPDSRNSLRYGLLRGTNTIGYGAGRNLLKEFWPDVRRFFHH